MNNNLNGFQNLPQANMHSDMPQCAPIQSAGMSNEPISFSGQPASQKQSTGMNNQPMANANPMTASVYAQEDVGMGMNPMMNQGMMPMDGMGMMGYGMMGADKTDVATQMAGYQLQMQKMNQTMNPALMSQEVKNIGVNQAKIQHYMNPNTEEGRKTAKLATKMMEALQDDNESRFEKLVQKLSPEQLAAAEILYGQQAGDLTALRKDIRSSFDNFAIFDKSESQMINMMNKAAAISPANAAIALKEAMDGVGTDTDTVNNIVNNQSKEFLNATTKNYDSIYGSLTADIQGDYSIFSGEDKLVEKIDNSLID